MSALRLPTGRLEEIPPFRSRSLSEDVLFRGHRLEGPAYAAAAPVASDCACGIRIVAVGTSPGDIQMAVANHNRMPEHQAYRVRMARSSP